MGGTNPYIEAIELKPRTQPYRLTIESTGQSFEISPDWESGSSNGLPGSILDIALANGVEIDHACGGVCACSTCHVYVSSGLNSCNESSDDEEDMLDMAPALKASSRLACQCVPDGSSDVVVQIPGWNRNLVKEEH